jgi:8-hydroxy-5-deazaflavin:NADPH oxidoreductase
MVQGIDFLPHFQLSTGQQMAPSIGILGSGDVGLTLANGFLKHGYKVALGTNTPSKVDLLREKTDGKAAVGSFEQTAKFGDMLVLAVKGSGALEAVRSAGIANLHGKVILDTTNPIADAPPVHGVLSYTTSLGESLMEQLQAIVPGARFVKAFSSVGSALMVNPNLRGGTPSMFICGNDETAKAEVRSILTTFGWETEDMGGAEAARAIEPLAMLWCIPGFLKNDWMHAFKLLRP